MTGSATTFAYKYFVEPKIIQISTDVCSELISERVLDKVEIFKMLDNITFNMAKIAVILKKTVDPEILKQVEKEAEMFR
jgi:hypothetical protein